jgi:AbrB family looped-hinge helix DNA binding protein
VKLRIKYILTGNISFVSQKEKMTMITSKVGRRGQITLPSQVRRQTGIREGDRIALIPQGDQIIIRPLVQTLQDLRGSVPVAGPQDFGAIRQQVLGQRLRKADQDER